MLAVVLVGLLPLMSPLGAFTSDEGAYALQVASLERGGWEYDYRAAPYDPDGRHFPLVLSDRSGDRFFPYVKHPAYPLLLQRASSVLGRTVGLHVLLVAAALATAGAAWLLAAELDPRRSRLAFWLAAGSSVAANAYLLWAHALSAAVAGLSLVAAVRVARTGLRSWATPALAAGLGAGVLLRSEGLLFAGAVALVLGWLRLRQSGTASALAAATAAGAPAVVAAALEQRWIRSVVGGPVQGLSLREGDATSYLGGRVQGVWHELLQGAYEDRRASTLALVALFAVVGLAWIALRRGDRHWPRRLAVACGLAGLALVARWALVPDDPIPGFLTAWPVALLGLMLVRWRGSAVAVRALGAVGVLFAVAVLATQYPEGGGLEWGGRFLSPLVVPVAVLAALGLATRLDQLPATPGRALGVASLAGVAVVTAVVGLATVASGRLVHDRLVTAVTRHPADVTVTTVDALPRLAWRADDRFTWMRASAGELPGLLARLRSGGVERVSVVTSSSVRLQAVSPYPRVTVLDEPDVIRRGGQLAVLAG